jgi:dienelactone hydrolase
MHRPRRPSLLSYAAALLFVPLVAAAAAPSAAAPAGPPSSAAPAAPTSATPAMPGAGGTASGATPPARPAPGPALLHEPPRPDPAMAAGGRWRVPPTMVSGTTIVQDGELVHTGWVFDDNGADTIPVPLLPIVVDGEPALHHQLLASRTGDVVYPRDPDRYAGNAADLVEVRARVDDDAVAFRIVLNTVREAQVAAVAIGIDTTGSDEVVDWGHGLGALGPTGVDHVVYTDGENASLTTVAGDAAVPVATTIDVGLGRIEVEVPRHLLDVEPDAVWRLYGVSGLADGAGGFVPIQLRPTETEPGGDPDGTAPPVFDVAFRHDEQEPLGVLEPEARSGQAGLHGSWRDAAAARGLARRDISPFSVDLDLAALHAGRSWSNVPTAGTVNRLYHSPLDLEGGVGPERPFYRSARQPYTIHVPRCVEAGETPVLTLALHSLSANHNQYRAASPGFYEQLGEDRCSVVVTSLGHGPDGWYLDEAEADLFAVLADVLDRYEIDLGHTIVHGYSMGGYGTYRVVGRYPDLFAAAFPVVGPPNEGIVLAAGLATPDGHLGHRAGTGTSDPTTATTPYLDSFRHVPTLAWHAAADELVPVTSASTHHQRQLDNGYRLRHEIYASDHFALAFRDRWERALDVLGERPAREADPEHVTYRVLPARDRTDLGLVADHAYWVADVEVADPDAPDGGLVDARSYARGAGDPIAVPFVDAGEQPLPFEAHGLEWTGTTEEDPRDRLELTLDNVGHLTLHLEDRGLFPSDEVEVAVRSDGPARAALVHHAGVVEVVRTEGADVVANHDGWLVIEVEAGGTLVVLSSGDVGDAGDAPRGESGDQAAAGDRTAGGDRRAAGHRRGVVGRSPAALGRRLAAKNPLSSAPHRSASIPRTTSTRWFSRGSRGTS